MPSKILICAGEASGDLYAARLAAALLERRPDLELFGCAGPRMRQAGVRPVVDAASLAVVGLVEVVAHIPRIYREFRKIVAAAEALRPDVAILTDSPDFHLRLAAKLKRLGIPVVYLIAPQVWAWRRRRIHALRRNLDRLLCIFPFEEEFFRSEQVPAVYIGHPLSRMVRPALAKEEFFQKHRIPSDRPLVGVLPGSRRGEVARHLAELADAVDRISRRQAATFILGAPVGLEERFFQERLGGSPIRVVQGETWDLLAHADVALAASGTVTVEAALLGTPMVSFYKVSGLSWRAGRWLVRVPHLTMVNLVAGRRVVPELMQNEMRGERIAEEALRLLEDSEARARMRRDLEQVAASLSSSEDPMERAAQIVEEFLTRK